MKIHPKSHALPSKAHTLGVATEPPRQDQPAGRSAHHQARLQNGAGIYRVGQKK